MQCNICNRNEVDYVIGKGNYTTVVCDMCGSVILNMFNSLEKKEFEKSTNSSFNIFEKVKNFILKCDPREIAFRRKYKMSKDDLWNWNDIFVAKLWKHYMISELAYVLYNTIAELGIVLTPDEYERAENAVTLLLSAYIDRMVQRPDFEREIVPMLKALADHREQFKWGHPSDISEKEWDEYIDTIAITIENGEWETALKLIARRITALWI